MVIRRRFGLVAAVVAGLALAGCAGDPSDDGGKAMSSDAAANAEAIGGSLRAGAVASQNAQNFAGAVAYYNSLYRQNRDDLDAALGLARNLRFLGDVTQATRVLEEVWRAIPTIRN